MLWEGGVTNKQVFQRAETRRSMFKQIKKELILLGISWGMRAWIIREGRSEGANPRRRPCSANFITQVKKRLYCKRYAILKRKTRSEKNGKLLQTNLRHEYREKEEEIGIIKIFYMGTRTFHHWKVDRATRRLDEDKNNGKPQIFYQEQTM